VAEIPRALACRYEAGIHAIVRLARQHLLALAAHRPLMAG
jgi:hypothetical protein